MIKQIFPNELKILRCAVLFSLGGIGLSLLLVLYLKDDALWSGTLFYIFSLLIVPLLVGLVGSFWAFGWNVILCGSVDSKKLHATVLLLWLLAAIGGLIAAMGPTLHFFFFGSGLLVFAAIAGGILGIAYEVTKTNAHRQ